MLALRCSRVLELLVLRSGVALHTTTVAREDDRVDQYGQSSRRKGAFGAEDDAGGGSSRSPSSRRGRSPRASALVRQIQDDHDDIDNKTSLRSSLGRGEGRQALSGGSGMARVSGAGLQRVAPAGRDGLRGDQRLAGMSRNRRITDGDDEDDEEPDRRQRAQTPTKPRVRDATEAMYGMISDDGSPMMRRPPPREAGGKGAAGGPVAASRKLRQRQGLRSTQTRAKGAGRSAEGEGAERRRKRGVRGGARQRERAERADATGSVEEANWDFAYEDEFFSLEDEESLEEEWDEMTVDELKERLQMELNFGREEFREWLQTEGREVLDEERAETGEKYDDEEWAEEMKIQLALFDKFHWPDELAEYIKLREAAEADQLATLAAQGASSADAAPDLPAEAEPQDSGAEVASVSAKSIEEKKALIRSELRNTRIERALQALDDVSVFSDAPTRKGRPLNQEDYELLKTATMWDMLEPDTLTGVQGDMLTNRQAQDARHLINIYTDKELDVNFDRPTLFPAETEQLTTDVLKSVLDYHRPGIVHPLMGVIDDEDWEELKEQFFSGPYQTEAMKDLGTARREGYSGFAGGYLEEYKYLHKLASSLVPEDHAQWSKMKMFMKVIRTNAQWPWPYKEKAIRLMAKTLTAPDRAAARAEASS